MKYKTFGKTGLSVSQIALGTGNFGTGWGYGADPVVSEAMFNTYAEAGGNFIDTADIYQFGQSEELLGALLQGRRDDFVLATKFTNGASANPGRLTTGNSRKAMVSSVEASLKRLKTDRIDLYWAHHPDAVTPIEEILRGLEDLARAGKILYAGLSNFPAWRLARAVTLAEISRTLPIAAAQFEHSLVHREPEADLFQASYALGLGIVTWSPLGGGMLTGKYRQGEKGRAEGFGGKVFQPENSAQRTLILDSVLDIAAELGVSASQVAIAWAGTHGAIPIIGPRSQEQIGDNLGALALTLADEQIQRLDAVSSLDPTAAPRSAVDWSDVTRTRVVA
ncbi:Oxidoreductase, aldo/keto reductase protein [Pseudomonas syringae pv. antirrhini]|uniref:Oxidoreductase, aldo/keto reductase family protein n=1 Tax=Pseudomonas syringae pv. antirrhini TaxID=251702 RepID=A0A0N8QPI5_9PSED|nr:MULTISPECIES: aldo/keto reductase [Pseudomonas]KPW50486.1 Oxidoreductase, aldo/keto reductase family protein [Pseudomonas syringae pv. antirrhini]RMP30523.1 Oxidoreductase, aldo/keto reductase protein [Pseudomonas syringae pv. antirrhini]RMP44627.1 Oxidoreductase, aldo/keto reductase protein [Pseudomonas syringae pv. antirrhini]RMW21980.1 Oxidoreductase, aldo/keto reductase protein [Pseudomonas syringae pv. antirrhini]WIN09776.1 aldo/keto reductase [Pseudomonas syringae pv. antirrhini str. 